MAIGNGILSDIDQLNSVIDLYYWNGMLGMESVLILKQKAII